MKIEEVVKLLYESPGIPLLQADEASKAMNDLQKAFALACRLLGDDWGCPADIARVDWWPECNGEAGSCGDDDIWKCWQKYFLERVDQEPVCRICGCTQENACPGGCYWVEPDLCSGCANPEDYVEVFVSHCQCGETVDDDDEACPGCGRPVQRT